MKSTVNIILSFLLFVTMISCGGGGDKSSTQSSFPEGLDFPSAKNKQAYCDMLLNAISTSRHGIVYDQFADKSLIDEKMLREYALSYGQAISKKDWKFESYPIANGDQEKNIGYRWIDERLRTAIIVEIESEKVTDIYKIKKLSFASRLGVLASRNFPGEVITDENILLNSPKRK